MKNKGMTLLEHCQEEIQKLEYNIKAGKDPKNARNHLDGIIGFINSSCLQK